jgi:hypothetical protein
MAISRIPFFAATCKSCDLSPIQIGPKLKKQLWLETMKIARAHEDCRDVHEKRRLQSQFDALLSLIKGAAR